MMASTFLAKRYALLLCYLVLFVSEHEEQNDNLEQIYALWLRMRPSRSTFAALVRDMHDVGWIEKRPGSKRSAFELVVHKTKILDVLQMKPTVSLRRTWAYQEGLFDFKAFKADSNQPLDSTSRMANRWTLQDDLNRFHYPS